MLKTRLLVSAVLIPLFIFLCWLDARSGAAYILMPLAIGIASQCTLELCALFRLSSISRGLLLCGNAAILLSLWFANAGVFQPVDGNSSRTIVMSLGVVVLAYAIFVQVVFITGLGRFSDTGGHTQRISAEILGLTYIGLLLATVASLRWIDDGQLGYLALGSLVIGAKIGDVGGYTFGRLFGKTKLAPLLSPGKTRAGAVGAVVTAALGVTLWIRFAAPYMAPTHAIASLPFLLAFGASLGVVGLLGDLAESLLKRDAGMKDASHVLPAFGGLLDLVDSILFVGPTALLFWLAVPPVY